MWLSIASHVGVALAGALAVYAIQRFRTTSEPADASDRTDRNFFLEHPNIFRGMALVGIIAAAVLVALPFYHAGATDSYPTIDAAAAQALGAVVAGMALLVAVWAVNVTDKIARKIETSGENDDTIAANSKLHDQWQTVNLEFIRNDKLRLAWEPEIEGDKSVENFETRLAFTFYVMQILRLTMLYEEKRIDVSLEDASKLYWADWLTKRNDKVWNWVVDQGRGFSGRDLARIKEWAEQYAANQAPRSPSNPTAPSS